MAKNRPNQNRAHGVSGNPARAKEAELTVKQQREAKRQEKLAEYQRQLKKRQRGKLVWWAVAAVAVAAVGGLIAFSVVTAPPSYDPASRDGSTIGGVETFQNETQHVDGQVDYPQNPPAGGPHNQAWLNCGVYTEPQVDEHAVHSLEHGAVWVTYDADVLSDADVEALRAQLPRDYVILSPYEGLDTPIALSAWDAQLKLDSVDDERIPHFFEAFWRSPDVPEPGASCTGAVEGPGRI